MESDIGLKIARAIPDKTQGTDLGLIWINDPDTK